MRLESGTSTIGHLRVRSSEKDTWALESGLRGLLEHNTWQPSSLGRNAILCVRTMRDPLPRNLQPGSRSWSSSSAWQHAMQVALEDVSRRAVRPALGFVPSDAQAVVFADRAELLACLTADWLQAALDTWWWHSLESELGLQHRHLVQVWLDTPESIPAALEHLATTGHVVAFIKRLSDGQTQALVLAISACFGLPELHRTLEAQTSQTLEVEQLESILNQPEFSSLQTLSIPWGHWIPEANTITLPPKARALLGIGLGLQRKSNLVRSAGFARDLKIWFAKNQIVHQIKVQVVQDQPSKHSSISKSVQTKSLFSSSESTSEHLQSISARSVFDTDEVTTAEMPEPEASNHPSPAQIIHSKPQGKSRVGMVKRNPRSKRSNQQESPISSNIALPQTDNLESKAENFTPRLETQLQTRFGGLLFLLNLFLSLELYSDFTKPSKTSFALSPWDLLALIAERWCGPSLHQDPIWSLLEQLSGREFAEPPGSSFRAPKRWRIPAQWLEAFPETGVCYWTVEQGRFRARHPAGFCLVDVPAARTPTRQFKRFKAVYSNLEWQHTDHLEPTSSQPLKRLLAWLLPFLEARLSRALGIKAEQVGMFVCARAAQITDTSTHLEASFSLEAHPIELRLAGLDHDPGWIPAAGRAVRFHFQTAGEVWQ